MARQSIRQRGSGSTVLICGNADGNDHLERQVCAAGIDHEDLAI